MDIKELIERGETQSLEFKESLRLKDEIGETVSAFSNSDGGAVIVGVSNSGAVPGVGIGKNTLEELANHIKRNTDPQVFPSVKILEVGGKNVIMIEVKEGAEKPVFFKNHAYKRVGKTNQRISSSEMRKLAKESGGRVYWDERVCEDAGLEDVNKEKVEWFLKTRFTKRKVAIPSQMRFEEVLMNLGSAKRTDKEVKLTNAGILLFCRYPQRFIPLRILCARFRGVELSRTTIDSLDCSGTLVEIMEQTEEFIRRNTRLFGFRTSFSFRRIDKLEYPIEALREAVLNALVHRDYEAPSDISVFIFDDRIEITNPGNFPHGTTPENPLHIPRNPILCQLMRDIGYIEKYGTGIYFMKDVCNDWGIPEPEFRISDIETKIVFKSGGKAVVISEIEKLGVELNDRQRKGLKHAFMEGFINNQIYREINGVSDETSRRELSQLVEKGLLKIKGKGRSTKYVPLVGD